jgi:hypothetical protein
MTPKESELLHGMVNCFNTCHANFEETVGMVSSSRGLASEEVKTILQRLKHEGSKEYRVLRERLPAEFPL